MRRPKSVDALLEYIAQTLAGTYCCAGDGASVEDDRALMQIRDRLDEWDEGLMRRAKAIEKGKKRATRR
jgi:hypothetical protein